jgi:NAD(P)H-hydrate epimerase
MGMMGAALLAARACLRAGAGKLVCQIPGEALGIFQAALPEAICHTDSSSLHLENLPDLEPYHAIGLGPGIGMESGTRKLVKQVLQKARVPLVIDADALNIIAEEGWQDLLGENMVITPHPGEFRRLYGEFDNDFKELEFCRQLSVKQKLCIIFKGHYSFLSTPSGQIHFNSTGNPGMAKGGSGDVLTGMLTGFLSQKLNVVDACRLGMFVHGRAGDLAKNAEGEHSMLASDIVENIGPALLTI